MVFFFLTLLEEGIVSRLGVLGTIVAAFLGALRGDQALFLQSVIPRRAMIIVAVDTSNVKRCGTPPVAKVLVVISTVSLVSSFFEFL